MNETRDVEQVPETLDKWNWGAFLICPIWGICNGVPSMIFSVLPLVGFAMCIVAGIKGNKWAWENKRWKSVEEFEKTQKKWATIGAVFSVFIVLALFASSGDDTSNGAYVPSSTLTPAKQEIQIQKQASAQKMPVSQTHQIETKPKLEVVEHHVCPGAFDMNNICGTVVNNSNKEINYAQVEISLYDSDGSTIGSTSDTINNLEPGGKWKFNAQVFDDNVASYKIRDISHF